VIPVATNLDLNPKLIEQAVRLGGHKSKKEAVNAALDEYVRHRNQLRILDLFGTVDYYPDYDYKALRRGKRR